MRCVREHYLCVCPATPAARVCDCTHKWWFLLDQCLYWSASLQSQSSCAACSRERWTHCYTLLQVFVTACVRMYEGWQTGRVLIVLFWSYLCQISIATTTAVQSSSCHSGIVLQCPFINQILASRFQWRSGTCVVCYYTKWMDRPYWYYPSSHLQPLIRTRVAGATVPQ